MTFHLGRIARVGGMHRPGQHPLRLSNFGAPGAVSARLLHESGVLS